MFNKTDTIIILKKKDFLLRLPKGWIEKKFISPTETKKSWFSSVLRRRVSRRLPWNGYVCPVSRYQVWTFLLHILAHIETWSHELTPTLACCACTRTCIMRHQRTTHPTPVCYLKIKTFKN